MTKKEKVLIIKTGYSEVLDSTQIDSMNVSFGDVLRTTPILHVYKNDEVTWLTDKEALPLLEGNPYIGRLLTLDFMTIMDLLDEEFDTVINLEKNRNLCKLSNKIEAWRKYGFRFDRKTESPQAYDRALEVLTVGFDINAKRENTKLSQELLFEMVGSKWNGEEYVFSYKPKSKEIFDIGLNTKIGPKWPTKAWPMESWDQLEERLLKDGLKVTRQDKQDKEVLKNLYPYMDWINSSRLLITNDSLGMHLGFALKKKVVGLFGSSAEKEVYFYKRGEPIFPDPIPPCMPCFEGVCKRGRNCMEDIPVDKVYEKTKYWI
jgi:heptosyltransferase-2